MALSFGKIFAIGLGSYFLASLIPGALDRIFAADTSGWDPAVAGLWTLIPMGIIAYLVWAYAPMKGGSKGE